MVQLSLSLKSLTKTATGYDDGYWNDPLQEPTKCGFNIQYIDPENLRYCTISFDAGEGSVSETSR